MEYSPGFSEALSGNRRSSLVLSPSLKAATKCVTLGTCLILIGAAVCAGWGALAFKALICMAFVLVTSPTAAHAIARGAYKSGVRLAEPSVVDHYREALSQEGESK